MKRLWALLLMFTAFAAGAELNLGFNSVKIPAPPEFAETQKGDARFADCWFSPALNNEQLAVFVTSSDFAKGVDGEFSNYCYVQQHIPAKGRFFFRKDLLEVLTFYRKEGEASAWLEKGLKEAMGAIAKRSAGSVSFDLSSPKILPVYYEDPDAFCFSVVGLLKVNSKDGDSREAPFATSGAITIVRGNLLMFYVTDKIENLEDTRRILRNWIDQTHVANPRPFFENIRYLFPGSSVNGLDYWKVVLAGINGALAAVFIGCIVRWKKRKNA